METLYNVNLLKGSNNENPKFATKNDVLLMMNQMVIIHQMMKLNS